jgi:hypothetical protein
LIYQVISYATEYDAAFGGATPPGDDLSVLRDLWGSPELSEITSTVSVSLADWSEIREGIKQLASTPADELKDEWLLLAREAERLTDSHPLAAAIALTYALAALESVSHGDLYWSLADGAQPEWHPMGLVLARLLVRLRAIWSGELFVRRAIDTIYATNRYRHDRDADIRERAAEYERLYAELQRLRRQTVESLAWDLSAAHAAIGGPLAALLWTLGYPVDAEGVAQGDAPSRWVVESVIDDSLRRGDWDPLTQDIWRTLDARPEFDLDRYPLLHRKLIEHVGPTITRRIDKGSEPPVSQTYAVTAVAFFEGALNDEVRHQFEFVRDNWMPVLMPLQSSDAVRILALDALALSSNASEKADRMKQLAPAVPRLVENARSLGVIDFYDHSLDGIFGHLPVEDESDLLTTLDLIERYRVAGIGYWLIMTRPPLPDDPAAEDLLEREESLLEEIRGARFVRQIEELPRHYKKYSINADNWESFGNPCTTQSDTESRRLRCTA